MENKSLKIAVQKIKPHNYMDYRKYLGAIYDVMKESSDSFSYKQFSEVLGYGESTLMHQIIKGYRPLSKKSAQKLMTTLALKGADKKYFLTLVDYVNAKKTKDRDVQFQKLLRLRSESLPTELDQNMLHYFSEWYHPVIREMIELPLLQSDPKKIAQTLTPSITTEQAKKSLKLLESLGMICFDEKTDTYKKTLTHIDSGPRVKGMGLLGYHQGMIDRAKDSLTGVKAKRRNISAVTVRCSEEKAQRLKSMIQAFQTELLEEAEADNTGDQIYQINLQLFPFTEES